MFRRLAKGWSSNFEAAARKQKKDLMLTLSLKLVFSPLRKVEVGLYS
jgi:hypothetical protein